MSEVRERLRQAGESSGSPRLEVIERVRESLPEFARRNGIELTDQVMDNLAGWISTVVPPFVYRQACWRYPQDAPDEPFACACPGACSNWHRLTYVSREG